MYSVKLMMAGILIPSCALAIDANQPTAWTQEPKTFMGVDLQGDFLKNVDECSASKSASTEPCRIATETPAKFLIQGAKSNRVLLGYQLIVHLSDNKIEKLVFAGPSNSSALVADMLRTDYGPPTASKINLVKMKSGATFDNEVLQWEGESISICSQRNDEDLGTYSVVLTNSPISISNLQNEEQSSSPDVSQL
ncbi:hypothetical protein [Pseudomonas sp. HLS-6 TE3448]|jgi:hypothetical protein